MARKTLFFLAAIIGIGLILRLLFFQSVTFGYDQARDALQSISILKTLHPRVIGPTTDIKGLFHSPLYWYIVSPFYFFSGGNPAIARIPMILINLCTTLLIYFIAKELFKNEKLAFCSSFFMAVSYEAVQYARWLSNPPPALITIGIFFYAIWLALKKKPIGFPLMIFVWGFSVDFQFFLIYQVIFIIGIFCYLIIRQRDILVRSFKKLYWLYVASILPWIFYIASEIKFKFQGLRALLGFFTKHDTSNPALMPKIVNFFNSLVRNVAVNLTGHDKRIGLYVLLFLLAYSLYIVMTNKKMRGTVIFLLTWLISPIFIYPLEKNYSYFLNIGNLYPLILVSMLVLFDISSRMKRIGRYVLIMIILVIAFLNIRLIVSENKKGEMLFSLQDSQVLTDEKKIIDFTYLNSGKKMFSFNTLTNPLFINTTWAYLYNWYGKTKYGYMPIWEGAYLDDFGKEIKFTDASLLKIDMPHYMIYEPPIFPKEYITTYSRYENKRSDLLKTVQFGTHVVEARRITKIIHFFRDDISMHLQDQ